MTYAAMDIANYIVKKSIELKRPISNLRLQKLLYYIQARFLVETGEPLFCDEIGKWKYGPVIPSVYHEFKKYGSGTIDSISEQLLVERNKNGDIVDISVKHFNEDDIDLKVRGKIEETVNSLSKYGTFDLVHKTHEQSLWKQYEHAIINNSFVEPYTDEEIKQYFSDHPEERIWENK